MAGVISKETYIRGFSWLAARRVDQHTHPTSLKSLYRSLNGVHVYHLDGLNTSSQFQGYFLGEASGNGKAKQNPHSMDREGNKEPLSTRVQLTGQPAVTDDNPQQ